MLKINGLTKNFKKVKAIDNFSFDFESTKRRNLWFIRS